jgi:hypothetical protein
LAAELQWHSGKSQQTRYRAEAHPPGAILAVQTMWACDQIGTFPFGQVSFLRTFADGHRPPDQVVPGML